jgi:DNA-binding XRE family transcriptional regulator
MANKNKELRTRRDGKYLSLNKNCRNGSAIYEHIVVMEKAIGRPLRKGEIVHHVNEDGHDNRPANLVLCENQAHHFRLHKEQNYKFLRKVDTVKGFNRRLARLRKREGMTQAEFGAVVEVSQQYVGALEAGLRRPGLALVFMMAAKFGVTEDWLKEGKGKLSEGAALSVH